MSTKTIQELLADSSLLHELLRKALPDDTIDRADVERRLGLLWKLDDRRLGLERLGKQVHGELSAQQQEALAKQQSQVGKHTIYSIVARHHRVEPYEADWKGKDCQSVRVTLPQSKDPTDKIWTHLGVVKASDHLLFSIDEAVERHQSAFGSTPTVGRVDLIKEYLDFFRSRFDTVISSVHHAGTTIPLIEEHNIYFDGYMLPINNPGMYMFPTQDRVVDAVRNTNKPVICIKPMAGGRYLGEKAFEYVFNDVGVESVMFGMATIEQVTETATAARSVLGLRS